MVFAFGTRNEIGNAPTIIRLEQSRTARKPSEVGFSDPRLHVARAPWMRLPLMMKLVSALRLFGLKANRPLLFVKTSEHSAELMT
jgi:hypothetical protein